MSLLRLIGNILWFVLGGFFMGLAWWLVGVIAFISIIGIPWGRACFVIGGFTFWPFGREAVSRRALAGREDLGTGPLGAVGNIIWLILFGWWLALGHVASAIADFITIIGIPFGIQHLKLALISLWPIGVQIIPSDTPVGRSRSG
ncbi:MAG TPA: YccF domain-containing protein [Gammaproteobacteria bacterium]|nr:YccF domain-containing protein [Gammaproteobacteria bacterium]